LPRQDFVITELGIDEKGNPTSDIQLRVELVTRADLSRGYLVRNSPTPFANSEFEIVRDVQGKLVNLSARSEDKTKETVEALISLAVKAAAFAGAANETTPKTPTLEKLTRELNEKLDAQGKLAEEIDALKEQLKKAEPRDRAPLDKQLRDKLDQAKALAREIAQLSVSRELLVLRAARDAVFARMHSVASKPDSFDPVQLKDLQHNLEKLNEHIATLEKDPKANPPKGVTKSGARMPVILKVQDRKEALQEASKLGENEVGIYLVPKS
jgi:HEPN domain-containing protein